MRGVLTATISFSALIALSYLVPANAESSLFQLRATEGLYTGRFPADNLVHCLKNCNHTGEEPGVGYKSIERNQRLRRTQANERPICTVNALRGSPRASVP